MGLVRILVGCTALVSACTTQGLEDPALLPNLDTAFFRCKVQPVLSARCAFMECHGSARRPLRVFAVQRLRLDVPWPQMATPLTDDELAANYEMARGFSATEQDVALLLTKPLDTAAGGYYHRGQDLYGDQDVFAATTDPGYQLLEQWLGGETSGPSCVMTEDVGR